MRITVRYSAQARQAAATAIEQVDVPASCRVSELLAHLADRHGDALRRILLDDRGAPQASLLLFIGDEQVRADDASPVADGAELTILSPIAGG